jgi:hypothetical protein
VFTKFPTKNSARLPINMVPIIEFIIPMRRETYTIFASLAAIFFNLIKIMFATDNNTPTQQAGGIGTRDNKKATATARSSDRSHE